MNQPILFIDRSSPVVNYHEPVYEAKEVTIMPYPGKFYLHTNDRGQAIFDAESGVNVCRLKKPKQHRTESYFINKAIAYIEANGGEQGLLKARARLVERHKESFFPQFA